MKSLTILVDMDDTIENLLETWVLYLNEKYHTNVSVDDINDWDIRMAFPSLQKEQIFDVLYERDLWQRVKPLPGAVEYMQKLIRDGHHIIIVTASGYKTIQMKFEEVLFRYFPIRPEDVVITSRKRIILGDVLVDDCLLNFIGGTFKGILFTAPHNRNVLAEKYGLKRANTWKDVYQIICDYAQEDSL